MAASSSLFIELSWILTTAVLGIGRVTPDPKTNLRSDFTSQAHLDKMVKTGGPLSDDSQTLNGICRVLSCRVRIRSVPFLGPFVSLPCRYRALGRGQGGGACAIETTRFAFLPRSVHIHGLSE